MKKKKKENNGNACLQQLLSLMNALHAINSGNMILEGKPEKGVSFTLTL